MRRIENFWKDHAYFSRSPFASFFFRPLSVVYQSLSWLKRKVFEGPFQHYTRICVKNPVISVGNLTVGGCGKTPFILWFLQNFSEHQKICLISRGYGARFKGKFARYQNKKWDQAGFFSDEAELCVRRFPQIECRVGKQRGVLVRENLDTDAWFLLDDAMQYWRLHRPFQICLVHGDLLFGNGRIFPDGPLRENPAQICRSSIVVISNPVKEENFYREWLLQYGYHGSVHFMDTRKIQFFDLDGKVHDISSDMRLGLLSSVANPEYFERDMQKIAEVRFHRALPDHGELDEEEQKKLLLQSETMADFLVITEKDWSKWKIYSSQVLVARQNICIREHDRLTQEILDHLRIG